MELVLEVISYKGAPSAGGQAGRFDERGGAIGRSEDNQLVLPDAEKIVSRRHARIRFEGGGFVLEDDSTGGTRLGERLLSRESAPLADGDRIRIGDYELLARLEGAVPGHPADIFGDFGSPLAASYGQDANETLPDLPGGEPLPLPVGTQPSYRSPPTPSFIDQPDAASFRQHYAPPAMEQSPAPPIPEEDLSLDKLFPDMFGAPPAAAPGKEGDFWGGIGFDPLAPPEEPLRQTPAEAPAPPSARAGEGWPGAETGRPAPAKPQPGRPPPRPPLQAAQPAEPAPARPQPPPPEPAEARPAPVEAADLLRCFLEGAGLPLPAGLTPEEQRKAMKAAGMAYREMVDGLMRVLLARKLERSEIALHQSDVTQFRRAENNPLKVFPTVEETLEQMVYHKNPAYVAAPEAAREAFVDILNHQLAMRAGMQAAVEASLRRLEPRAVEARYEEGFVFQKKAKCWDEYCRIYPRFVDEAMENLFGEAFASAYREQLRSLRGQQR